jgi:hypothetical protein
MCPTVQTNARTPLHVAVVKRQKSELHRPKDRPLLVVAHPGHELRLFGWLSEAKPDVLVLTDGSGHGDVSRIESTRELLVKSGAHAGSLFGVYTDRQIYRAMLQRDTALFLDMAARLTEIVCVGGYRMVVADPFEGYNPTHDLCRLLVNVAVLVARQKFGCIVRNYEYPLTELSNFSLDSLATMNRLSAADQLRKRAAAAAYLELTNEVTIAVRLQGDRAFAEEVVREVFCDSLSVVPEIRAPFYETYGERQRALGRYTDVIRYADHFLPIIQAVAGTTVRTNSKQGALRRREADSISTKQVRAPVIPS